MKRFFRKSIYFAKNLAAFICFPIRNAYYVGVMNTCHAIGNIRLQNAMTVGQKFQFFPSHQARAYTAKDKLRVRYVSETLPCIAYFKNGLKQGA